MGRKELQEEYGLDLWAVRVLAGLMAQEGYEQNDISEIRTSNFGHYRIVDFTDDTTYGFAKDMGEAEEEAGEVVASILTTEPSDFHSSWLMEWIDPERTEELFKTLYEGDISAYASEIEFEDASDPDLYPNRLEEEITEMGVPDVEDFVLAMTCSRIDAGHHGYDYYVQNFGPDAAGKILTDYNLIDVEGAAEDAVERDGAEHFLNSHDGIIHEIEGNRGVYWRID